jgi:Fic family protein
MSKLNEILKKVDENQAKIAEYGKFDDSILNKIHYKLRLDWNYYSNRMEGGTLTRKETRSVMVGNIEVNGKPFRDVAEMAGHDKIVLEVLKMSKGELSISEKRIKEIHFAIMYEEDAKKAQKIGKWKTEPNEIIGYKNEKIAFTSPLEVAEKVHQLIDQTNAELDKFKVGKNTIHPIEIAASFHVDFVSIHPFYDGNGRTSRILTNIILIACGYPAIIIKDEHKKPYHQLLGDIQAYGGNVDLFYEFIGERVLDTQKLIIDALEGKEIEEADDLDKEIELFKAELGDGYILNEKVNIDSLVFVIEKNIFPILEDLEKKCRELSDLFFEINKNLEAELSKDKIIYKIGSNESNWENIIKNWLYRTFKNENDLLKQLRYSIELKGFKKSSFGNNFLVDLKIDFEEFYYVISSRNMEDFKLHYDKIIDDDNKRKIISHIIRQLITDIKLQTK